MLYSDYNATKRLQPFNSANTLACASCPNRRRTRGADVGRPCPCAPGRRAAAQGFLDRCRVVPAVAIVEIDVIGLQRRKLYSTAWRIHVVARRAPAGSLAPSRKGKLGRHDNFVHAPFERVAESFLRAAVGYRRSPCRVKFTPAVRAPRR